MAAHIDNIKYWAVDVIGMYNFFDPVDLGETVHKFCIKYSYFCELMVETFASMSREVDNFDRAETFATHFPSGAGWKNFIHYG